MTPTNKGKTMVRMLEVEWDDRSVTIDGEMFPCAYFKRWERGGLWRIPMESGLFAEFCQGSFYQDSNEINPGLTLHWADDITIDYPGDVTLQDGLFVRRSGYKWAQEPVDVTSGAEIRQKLREWTQHLPIIDSQALRLEKARPQAEK